MRYHLSNTISGLSVRIHQGTEEERRRLCVLAENMFGATFSEDYSFNILCFKKEGEHQFKRLIKWKEFFDLIDTNKPYSFLKTARQSIPNSALILQNNVYSY